MIVRYGIAALATLLAAAPLAAEPVENGSEVAALLSDLDGRCWAVDIDGAILDADAMAQIEGPIDIELECVVSAAHDAAQQPRPFSARPARAPSTYAPLGARVTLSGALDAPPPKGLDRTEPRRFAPVFPRF